MSSDGAAGQTFRICTATRSRCKVFADPQVQHLGIAAPVHSPLFGDTRMVASALNFTGASRNIRSPTPEPGAHTDEVLNSLGYSDEDVNELRAAGVV